VHFVENELGFSQYPMVPGHELIGVVTAVGANVDGFKVSRCIPAPQSSPQFLLRYCWASTSRG